jgi:DNA gyrase subunit A
MSDNKIIFSDIVDEMSSAYIDYSMSVIVSRALPDIRDGLKPIHRRILYGMFTAGMFHNKSYKKSAKLIGEVMGKFHPHGEASIYDALVRMAQNWSLRYTLVDGQGNFGSIDGDNAAATRYTECRMSKCAEELLIDIDKETIKYQENYDGSIFEPTVLPSKIPNLLINGASGIAVGMATNMPPHNLSEVCDAIVFFIDKKGNLSIEELMNFIKAPDFPTGGIIQGLSGVKEAFHTGRGRVVIRSKVEIEKVENKDQIVISEIPYMVNKAVLVEKIAQLVNHKLIEGISNIKDESNKNGIRIVLELKRDAISTIVLNNLFKKTQIESSFNINNIVLVNGRPKLVNLYDLIKHFVDHRHEVLIKKSNFELDQSNKKLHALEGYLKALEKLENSINLVKSSKDFGEAKLKLINEIGLSESQAKSVLEMRLQKITSLERDKIIVDHKNTLENISYLEKILKNEDERMNILKAETLEIKKNFGDQRRTEIQLDLDQMKIEDMICNEKVVITLSNQNYIKRTNLEEYKIQNRGGIGSKGVISKQDDFTKHLFIASTHDYLLIFTSSGKVFSKRVYQIPEAGKISKGRSLQNIIQISPDDQVQSIIRISSFEELDEKYIIICTKNGIIKKTDLKSFGKIRSSGICAITIRENDNILDAKLVEKDDHIIMASRNGKAIRFPQEEVRAMGRTASGVIGMILEKENFVVGLEVVKGENENLLVVSEKGFGKQSDIDDYRITHRSGKGVLTLNITSKTGSLVTIKSVKKNDEFMIINKSGIVIRLKTSDLRISGRSTQGVKLINLQKDDQISSVAKIENIIEED